eukprot:9333461-Alexandrium_andersonii.AAC.1
MYVGMPIESGIHQPFWDYGFEAWSVEYFCRRIEARLGLGQGGWALISNPSGFPLRAGATLQEAVHGSYQPLHLVARAQQGGGGVAAGPAHGARPP